MLNHRDIEPFEEPDFMDNVKIFKAGHQQFSSLKNYDDLDYDLLDDQVTEYRIGDFSRNKYSKYSDYSDY